MVPPRLSRITLLRRRPRQSPPWPTVYYCFRRWELDTLHLNQVTLLIRVYAKAPGFDCVVRYGGNVKNLAHASTRASKPLPYPKATVNRQKQYGKMGWNGTNLRKRKLIDRVSVNVNWARSAGKIYSKLENLCNRFHKIFFQEAINIIQIFVSDW